VIKENSSLYIAIENAIYDIFEGNIPLNDPSETTKIFVNSVNKELKNLDDENVI
jgi:hypothetical protein